MSCDAMCVSVPLPSFLLRLGSLGHHVAHLERQRFRLLRGGVQRPHPRRRMTERAHAAASGTMDMLGRDGPNVVCNRRIWDDGYVGTGWTDYVVCSRRIWEDGYVGTVLWKR